MSPSGAYKGEIDRYLTVDGGRSGSYRKLSLKYHPDKQTPETKEEMKEQFVKISNGASVRLGRNAAATD